MTLHCHVTLMTHLLEGKDGLVSRNESGAEANASSSFQLISSQHPNLHVFALLPGLQGGWSFIP